MKNNQIKELIKEAHKNAIDKGFYDCKKCKGKGWFDWREKGEPRVNLSELECSECNGSGTDPNKNIGELLMLIVSELSEALEAHRCGRFAEFRGCYSRLSLDILKEDLSNPTSQSFVSAVDAFEKVIKDTFEDEIADVFIRLFDLCGYLEIEPDRETMTSKPMIVSNVAECLIKVTYELSFMVCSDSHNSQFMDSRNYGFIFAYLNEFCNKYNIQIEKHINAKMAYNKTRPRLHGKKY